MKKWETLNELRMTNDKFRIEDLVSLLLRNRGLKTKKQIADFLNPQHPSTLTPLAVGIDPRTLKRAIDRIRKALKERESVVVYADYDADGITGGAIMWEALYHMGANVMPYIPHRSEGYGLTKQGIETVVRDFNPSLVVTVDHGITAKENVSYAKTLGIDVIVTDHHTKPKALPVCPIVHTTDLSGAGVSWFVAKTLLRTVSSPRSTPGVEAGELLALAAIGSIADLMPLVGVNRAIVRYGLSAINGTSRVGLKALIADAGLTAGSIGTYEVSHILAPRLNAMGRIEHALDALRLLCTPKIARARLLAEKLGLTNRERQLLTEETVARAMEHLPKTLKKLIFIHDKDYNQGIIGLVAGKLVEEYYRPAIVISVGETFSKASARSVSGFNIVEAIRTADDLLVDVGGHPMAAGFTVETAQLDALRTRLEDVAEREITDDMLVRALKIDAEIPLEAVSMELWKKLRSFEPFGFGNPEPVFATRGVRVVDARLVGKDGKHLKLRLQQTTNNKQQTTKNNQQSVISNQQFTLDAIAFNFGNLYGKMQSDTTIDIAYTISLDSWNEREKLQLKIRDIHVT